LELFKGNPASLAYLEVLFGAPSLTFTQRAIEIVGDHVDQVVTPLIIGARLAMVSHRSLFPRSSAPDGRERGFELGGA
jgi:hypothetical protein